MRNGKLVCGKYSTNRSLTKVYFIVLFLLIQSEVSLSQTVSGIITSADSKEVLPGVTILANDTSAVTSDTQGRFTLTLTPGTHTLYFRLISFETLRRKIFLTGNENLNLTVALNPSTQMLHPIVISAGKFEQRIEDVTVSMEVLKPQLIEKRNTVTMEDAVDFIPGVNVIDGQANIRGGSGWSYGAGSRVQILVDDLPQLTADANDTKWTFLPIENIEQVEVLKGASSVLFGSSALNGVINFRTAYPRDTPQTKLNVFAAVYDNAYITTDKKYSLNFRDQPSYYSGINFLHSRKINRLDLVASGNFFRDNGYRKGENELRGRLGLNVRYRLKPKGLSAALNVNSIITDGTQFFLWKNDTTGAYLPADSTLSDYVTYRTSIDPSLTYIGSNGNSHKLRTRWFNNTNTNNTNQYSRGDLFYTEYQFQKRFRTSFTLTTGIVNIFSLINSEMFGDHEGNQSAAYAQGDLNWKRFNISGGSRVEQSKIDAIRDKWTPVFRAGISYRIFDQTHFRISAGQAYRFPSVAERFARTNVSGINIFPNVDLQPEKGVSYEAGIRQGYRIAGWKGIADLAFFQNDYKNMMEFVFAQWMPELGFQGNGFKSVNVGDTRIRGFELNIAGESSLQDLRITALAGYTFLDPRQLTYDSAYVKKIGYANYLGSDSSDFLKYRYRHMLKGDLEVGYKRFAFGTSLRYNSVMKNIDKIFIGGLLDFAFPPGLGIGDYRKYRTKGDWVVDSRLSYSFSDKLLVLFIVKNVFNHIYMQRPADMQPPRSFVLQASMKI